MRKEGDLEKKKMRKKEVARPEHREAKEAVVYNDQISQLKKTIFKKKKNREKCAESPQVENPCSAGRGREREREILFSITYTDVMVAGL